MMAKLGCGCTLSEFMTIPKDDLSAFTGKQLRAYANAHNVGPAGQNTQGWSSWRNNASPQELRECLIAHRDNAPMPTPHHITDGGQLPESLAVLPELVTELSQLLGAVNPETVGALVDSTVRKQLNTMRDEVQQFQVVVNGETPGPTFDLVHRQFKPLLKVLATGSHVMLVGGAGSGKTEGAMMAAKALGKEFELISVGPQTLQSELAGYKTATGDYIKSAVRRAYESGKILIIDEMDAGNPGVFTFLNSTLSNAAAGYPDGVAERGEGFQAIACTNTFGTGADMVYVGRSQQDGATLDRYIMLEWDYDEQLELALALRFNEEATGWVKQVQNWRKNMMKHRIRHVISPRASMNGAKLLKAGFSVQEVAKMTVFKGLNKEGVDKITGTAGVPA